MQDSKLHTILIATLLMLSIFSFSTATLVEDVSALTYEILLDDGNESDDKEEEQEKKLFTFSQDPKTLYNTDANKRLLTYKNSKGAMQHNPHFRPPIFS